MNYEEKYNEALERARKIHNYTEFDYEKGMMEEVFPELAESEDERIRKALIRFHRSTIDVDGIKGEDIIAWLEKQGEHNDSDVKDYNSIDPHFGKSIDKIEPNFNFKAGQWIVATGKCVYLITKIDGFNVTLVDVDGNEYVFDTSSLEDARLWTINDAKDGDVLVASDDSIFLFAGVVDCACKYYAALTNDNYVKINKETIGGYWETSKAAYPATKEQSNLLFQKMKEAGYEWNEEKKELRKIEQKSTWSEEDEEMIDNIMDYIKPMPIFFESTKGKSGKEYTKEFVKNATKWLKALKQRMGG